MFYFLIFFVMKVICREARLIYQDKGIFLLACRNKEQNESELLFIILHKYHYLSKNKNHMQIFQIIPN
jgi:hypothetical protein